MIGDDAVFAVVLAGRVLLPLYLCLYYYYYYYSLDFCSHTCLLCQCTYLSQTLWQPTATRSVTTLQETLAAQVPEKQKKMAQLKKEHGSHVYVRILVEKKALHYRTVYADVLYFISLSRRRTNDDDNGYPILLLSKLTCYWLLYCIHYIVTLFSLHHYPLQYRQCND